MQRPAISEIINEDQSCYSLVIAVSKRAREIVQESEDNNIVLVEKPVKTAVEQFARGEYHLEESPEVNI